MNSSWLYKKDDENFCDFMEGNLPKFFSGKRPSVAQCIL